MIPRKLYMRNFMCYREQAIDFTGIHLACLTGNNGHGKSAILDALTWALWGRSRLGARRDDELIHIGQREMEVEFEFALPEVDAANGEVRYRVLRKRDSRRRGQSSLDLQGWDAQEARFRPLSEPSISATQEKIDGLLRLDYDTFINSAFLLQGRADEFTIKRPTERKRVLSDIMGLGMYDRYERLAKEAAGRAKEQADRRLAAMAQIDNELAREREYEAAVRAAEATLERVQRERVEVEASYDQVRAALGEAEAAQRQLDEVERRLVAARAERARLSNERARHEARLGELELALAQQAEIEAGFAAFQRAREENEALNAKLAELVTLNRQHSEAEQRIAAARHELEVARMSAAEQARQLQDRAAALEQQEELQEVQTELARLDARLDEREGVQGEMQALAAEMAAWSAENKRAESDAAQIKDKIELLSADTASAQCPLCGQPLGQDGCARLLDDLQAELEAERAAYAERVARIREGQQRTQALRATLADIDRDLRQRTGQQRKEAALAHVLREARVAYEALPHAEESVHGIEKRLAEGDYALEARQARAEVERQLAELGYDADAHRQVQAQVEAARPNEARMDTLREARSNLETVRLALSQLAASQAEVEGRLAEDGARAGTLQESAGRLPGLRRQAMEARQIMETAHDREQQANLQLGAARNKLDYCADLRRQRVARHKEEQALREEQGVYEELQRAFGKNGVQAMLIESAIPDIEEEANRVLARMTRGTMHVRFDTQRDTRRGDTIETLDIHISDSLGTRAYETYSGGERYRINFAIRIALSKLLARRAGARLRLLVIDEGFGTQDTEGRDGLIDAIHAVSDDFSCILAITHIEELKNMFNVRIEVEKTAEGSTITIT